MNREKYQALVEKILKLRKDIDRSIVEKYDRAASRRLLGQYLTITNEKKAGYEVLESILRDFKDTDKENYAWTLLIFAEHYVRDESRFEDAIEYATRAKEIAQNSIIEYWYLSKAVIEKCSNKTIDEANQAIEKRMSVD